MPSFMLARLERDTYAHHADAAADRCAVFDDATRDGYRRFLAAIYHFEYAFESQLVSVAELPIRFVATRLRSGLLADDLCALGVNAGAALVLARPLEPPKLTSTPEALGWMYAVQRNTLGHADLVRALAPRLRGLLGPASRYLTAYAPNVYQRWAELGAELDRIASQPAVADRIIAAAHDAFARQHAWYSSRASWQSHGEGSLSTVERWLRGAMIETCPRSASARATASSAHGSSTSSR